MLFSPLPLTLLSLLPFYLCAANQHPFTTEKPELNTTRTTLVDVISADPDFSTLLYLLQRSRLIPTLNRLNGSAFFAPTNDAIKRHTATNGIWASAARDARASSTPQTRDNVNEQLRQELLYHLVNYTLDLPSAGEVKVAHTLHYPRKKIDPPTHEPPPGPPWMPLPGGTLGGAPQRLRYTARQKTEKENKDDELWTAVDFKGDGGTKVIKQQDGGNGLLLKVGDVLPVPPDLATIVSQHPKLLYLRNILPDKMFDLLKETPELTLFLPIDKSWDTLSEINKIYLESEFAADDLLNIVKMHTVWKSEVHWSEKLKNGSSLDTLYGSDVAINVRNNTYFVNESSIVEPDIYASNGVLHLVDGLLIPPGALEPTPEKYLLALNCSKFVSLLHSVNLTHLVNGTTTKSRTILTIADDILALDGDHGPELPSNGSDELRRALEYHFLPERWTPKKLKDGMLLETELIEAGLNGSRQVLPIELSDPSFLEEDVEIIKRLRFGGAGLVGKPIEINNTIIYQLSKGVQPPSDVLTEALPSLQLSTFIAAVFSADLDYRLKTSPSTSILIPQNDAFQSLGGLITTHLLSSSPASKADLGAVIQHHVVEGVYYYSNLTGGSQTSFRTMEGSDLRIERKGDSFEVIPSGGWVGVSSELQANDRLTQTGVLYEVSDILIPRSIEITNAKLFKAAGASTMAGLVAKVGMGWILNGTKPPDDSDWANEDIDSLGWTLLCPVDDAFNGVNLTELKADEEYLKAFIYQHIIPTPRSEFKSQRVEYTPLPLPLEKTVEYTTLQSRNSLYADLIFVRPGDDDKEHYGVRIKDLPESKSKYETARILSWGRCTTNHGTGGVIQIDQLLVPWQPSGWMKYGPPSFVAVLGVVVIGMFFWAVSVLWRKDTTEPTYEPLNGYDEDAETEDATAH